MKRFWNRMPYELQDIVREYDGYFRERMDTTINEMNLEFQAVRKTQDMFERMGALNVLGVGKTITIPPSWVQFDCNPNCKDNYYQNDELLYGGNFYT
jgi:hypothetical protein